MLSLSTGKSGSSWLNRLRTAKGFTDDGPADLENFLQNPNSQPLVQKPKPVSISDPTQSEDTQLFNIMNNVLNELFNFGDYSSNSMKFKKSTRKQKNPRICTLNSDGSRENQNAASQNVALLRSPDVEGVKELPCCENGGGDVHLAGFSRTDVTIIDTSYEAWKFEKFLYRKRNVWKVRDKKVKGESLGNRKKGKASGGSMEEEQRGGKKSKEDKNEEFPFNEMTEPEVCETARIDRPIKTKQWDSKLNDGSSSVILIKNVHTSTKNRSSISKICLKSKQKKTMLIGGPLVDELGSWKN